MATLERSRDPLEDIESHSNALLDSQVPSPFPKHLLEHGPTSESTVSLSTPALHVSDVDPFADQETNEIAPGHAEPVEGSPVQIDVQILEENASVCNQHPHVY